MNLIENGKLWIGFRPEGFLPKEVEPDGDNVDFPVPHHLASSISALTCVYRKLRLGRSGDEVRPGWQVT